MDSLVEAITELVIKELALAKGQAASGEAPAPTVRTKGARVLVVRAGEAISAEVWSAFTTAKVSPVYLSLEGASPEPPPAGWPVESRHCAWSHWVGEYRALCLLGGDLPTLGAIAALGAGGSRPAASVMAALSTGVPVFCEASNLERVRRHSSRLAPGLTRAFEEAWRTAASFGVEFGQGSELSAFLSALDGAKPTSAAAAKTGGRDVVTTEDVEAVRRSGGKTLSVGMGAIVTPLARQQASEWGIEVKFL